MKKTNETKKNKFSFKKWLIKNAPAVCLSFAAFVLLVGVLLIAFRAKEELVQYSIENENVYLVIGGERFDYSTQITLNHEDKVTDLYIGDEFQQQLYNEPLYFDKKDEAIFPNTMSVIMPIEGQLQKKVSRFTKVNGEGLQAILENQNLKYALTDGFLYDGANIYFFVEDGTLSWGENKVELSAMSFVYCYYEGEMYYYNYETKEAASFDVILDDVIMTFDTYSVNLSYDSVTTNHGSFLLHKNIEGLQKLTK